MNVSGFFILNLLQFNEQVNEKRGLFLSRKDR